MKGQSIIGGVIVVLVFSISALGVTPTEYDWCELGMCPAVRNIGGCGAVNAFAAIGAVECAIKIFYDRIGVGFPEVDLSEQWLISCTPSSDCGGGPISGALNYLLCSGGSTDSCGDQGAVLEDYFPYVADVVPCNCPYPHSYCLRSWTYLGSPSADAIKDAIMEHGPVVCLFDIYEDFFLYNSGIYKHVNGAYVQTSAGLLVGWGVDSGTEYWILRNCWGTAWGQNGYAWIARGEIRIEDNIWHVDYDGGAQAGIMVIESDGTTQVSKDGDTDSYDIVLMVPPLWDVVLVTASCNEQLQLNGGAPGQSLDLAFTTEDWYLPKTVEVAAVNDGIQEGPHDSTISHASYGGGYDGVTIDSVVVEIAGSGHWCGEPGQVYHIADLDGDCYVNFFDFLMLANNWLKCTDLRDPNCSWD